MQQLLKRFSLILMLLLVATVGYANESTASLIVESNAATTLSIIESAAKQQQIAKQSIGNIMQWVALQMLEKPYVPALLDKPNSQEYMFISLDATDCMLFVEHVLAVSELIKKGQLNLDNLAAMVKEERYHGKLAYCNRNHYFKDWALENQKNGFVIDEAMLLTGIALPYDAHVLSDFIGKNPQGHHFIDFSCIKQRELFINNRKLGFIPLKQLPKYLSAIKQGDIIGIVRTPKGRADSIHHLAIAYVTNGQVGMIDASSDYKKVVIAESLMGYLNSFPDSQGIILLRARQR